MQSDARCSTLSDMAFVRQTVSLPPTMASRVRALAKKRRTSTNKVLVDLVGTGLEAKQAARKRIQDLTRRIGECKDAAEADRLGDELMTLVFGE